MIREGTGRQAPPPVVIPIDERQRERARQYEAMKREQYAARSDAWGQGIRADACFIGKLGEYVVGDYLRQPTDDAPRRYGDGGVDFRVGPHTVQVKATSTRSNMVPVTQMRSADVFVFVHVNANATVGTIRGFCTRGQLLRAPQKQGRVSMNAVLTTAHLTDVRELRALQDRSRGGTLGLIRYPGSKQNKLPHLLPYLDDAAELFAPRGRYVEPCAGAFGVGLQLLKRRHSRTGVWINDRDPGIANMWEMVLRQPDALAERLLHFVPSVDAFQEFRARAGDDAQGVDAALERIALHQMSYSGLGPRAGGPIGGANQSGAYNVGCRFVPSRMATKVLECHRILTRHDVEVSSIDAAEVVRQCEPGDRLYVDPPYYEKGPDLYAVWMEDAEHEALAQAMRATRASRWAVSYDDHPRVRSLYGWANIHEVQFTYTMTHGTGAGEVAKTELVIVP